MVYRRLLTLLFAAATLSATLAAPLDTYVPLDKRFINTIGRFGRPEVQEQLEQYRHVSIEVADPATLAYLSLFPLIRQPGTTSGPRALLPLAGPVTLDSILSLDREAGELQAKQSFMALSSLGCICTPMLDPELPDFVTFRPSIWAGDDTGQTVQWEMHVQMEKAEIGDPFADLRQWSEPWLAALKTPGPDADPELVESVRQLAERAAADLAAGPPTTEPQEGLVDITAARVLIRHSGEGEACRIEDVVVDFCWPMSLPVFMAGERGSQRLECLNNAKQIGMAFMMYAQDWEERFPPADNWFRPLQEYVKNPQVYLCPCDEAPVNGLSYFYNAKLSKLSLGKLDNPSETILAAEGKAGSGGPERLVPRHNGKVIVVFADGHVELLTMEQASDPKLWKP